MCVCVISGKSQFPVRSTPPLFTADKKRQFFFSRIVPKFRAQFLKSVTFFVVFSWLQSSLDIKTDKCFTTNDARVGKLLVSLSEE